jgi:hypothetical protein
MDKKEYITWGYDKDHDVWEEYYRGDNKEDAVQMGIQKTVEMEGYGLFRKCDDGSKEPIDWIEVVTSKAEEVRDYKEHLVWSSYDNFITMEDLTSRLKDYDLEGVEISYDDVLDANMLAFGGEIKIGREEAIDKVLLDIRQILDEGLEDEVEDDLDEF